MKVALFCGDRQGARRVLEEMLHRGITVVGCVFEEPRPNPLSTLCEENRIPCYKDGEMYAALEAGTFPKFDWGISYLHHKILKKEIIGFAGGRILNFHPAPTDVHRGVAACCYCLLHGYKEWAVTAHYVTPGVDDGDIVAKTTFPLDGVETGQEAEVLIQEHSMALFGEVLSMLLSGQELKGTPQKEFRGVYYSRAMMDEDKKVRLSDDAETVRRKARAFWFPPYHGAYLKIGGEKFSLASQEILEKLVGKTYSIEGEYSERQGKKKKGKWTYAGTDAGGRYGPTDGQVHRGHDQVHDRGGRKITAAEGCGGTERGRRDEICHGGRLGM